MKRELTPLCVMCGKELDSLAQNSLPAAPALRYWICTDWLKDGGRKILGPFDTSDLAIAVRSYIEQVNKPKTYCVDSEPARLAVVRPTRDQLMETLAVAVRGKQVGLTEWQRERLERMADAVLALFGVAVCSGCRYTTRVSDSQETPTKARRRNDRTESRTSRYGYEHNTK